MSSQFHSLHCEEPWFSLLASCQKPVEGRKNSPKNAVIQAGDYLSFYCEDKSFVSEVVEVKKYPSLEAYLRDVTIEKALPGITSFEDAIHTYLQWNSREDIEKLGFLGIFIQPLPTLKKDLYIRKAKKNDEATIKNLKVSHWGGEPLIIHGKPYFPSNLDGLFICSKNEILGFLFYDKQPAYYEIIVFEVFQKFQGLGTFLMNEFMSIVKKEGGKKIEVMTTNDNLDALRFYQRRGFTISRIDINQLETTRALKKSCGRIGDFGIPCRDEIILERSV
jgi:ASC-1-like (ASCH) protein